MFLYVIVVWHHGNVSLPYKLQTVLEVVVKKTRNKSWGPYEYLWIVFCE